MSEIARRRAASETLSEPKMAIVSCHVSGERRRRYKNISGGITNPRVMLTRKLRRHTNCLFFLISRIPEAEHCHLFISQLIRPAEIITPSATDQKYGFAQFGEDDVDPADKYRAGRFSIRSRCQAVGRLTMLEQVRYETRTH